MKTNFGPNSVLSDDSGAFACRAGCVIVTKNHGLVVVTLKLHASSHQGPYFWNGHKFEDITDRIAAPKKEGQTSSASLFAYLNVPAEVSQHSKLCSDVIWPREFAERSPRVGEEIFFNEDLTKKNPLGEIVSHSAQAILNSLGPESTDLLLTNVSIAALYNSNFLADGILGASLIDERARLIGFCAANKYHEDSSGMDTLILAASDVSLNEEFSLWSPPGSHWLDLEYRSSAFRARAAAGLNLDLGDLP